MTTHTLTHYKQIGESKKVKLAHVLVQLLNYEGPADSV